MNNLKMSKKRKRKIMITDIAISKVPYIEYKEVPKKENKNIYELVKQTLLISKEENNSNEVAIIYSMNHIKGLVDDTAVCIGVEHEVDLFSNPVSSQLLRKCEECAIVISHNHPNLTGTSLQDIDFFINWPTIKLLITVTNEGKIFYLVKTSKFNIEKANDILDKALLMLKKSKKMKEQLKANSYFIKNASKAGIICEK